MDLKETAGLLGWKRELVEIAISEGVKTPQKKLLTKLAATKQGSSYDIREEDVDSFLAAFEAEEPGRYPPVAIRRKLLIEAGYQCAICESDAPLNFHHIVDWANLKHHDPKQMLAVCGSCHDKIGIGIIDTKAQIEIKTALTSSNHKPSSSKASPADDTLHCLIELDERLSAIGGKEALVLAIDEIIADLQAGREPNVAVKIKNYSDIKAELAKIEAGGVLSQETRKRAFQCREILEKYDLWDKRLDELFAEAVLLIARNFRKLVGYITKQDFAFIIQEVFNFRFASGLFSGVKFDIFEDKEESGFGIWITEEQAESLAKAKGASDVRLLTRFMGLDLYDLPREILIRHVIPAMVHKFLWYKYAAKKPRTSEDYYFKLDTWNVGLG
jgi:hypothetical protein